MRIVSIFTRFPFLVAALLTACSSASPEATATPSQAPTASVPSTSTPALTPIPPALPAPYQSSLLDPLDTPHTYIAEPCQYLRDKWASGNSAPGTVVMAITFHTITKGPVTNPAQISEYSFRLLMTRLHDSGFQAINAPQLAHFMEGNAAIPPRSVLLVADDRNYAQYFDDFFRQYWEAWGWPVVDAWISSPLNTGYLWRQQEELNAEGWVDYEAQGSVRDDPTGPDSTDAAITAGLQVPIDSFGLHFDKKPVAVLWPGGGFAYRPAQIARQLGYRLGFTENPRGPLMYDWVPLADALDPDRPAWIPEGPAGDPLMVLPRYWDTDAIAHLDDIVQLSQEAAAYAQSNKAAELDTYNAVCAPTYGPIP